MTFYFLALLMRYIRIGAKNVVCKKLESELCDLNPSYKKDSQKGLCFAYLSSVLSESAPYHCASLHVMERTKMRTKDEKILLSFSDFCFFSVLFCSLSYT